MFGQDRPDLIPKWAETGQFRFSRWDGGPMEVAKAVLSGFPYFLVPNPEVVYATTNWYDPKTVDLLERAHINWIWVTWSTGFSDETESFQQTLLKKYIQECHRRGIHVSAYLSSANMFPEEIFQRVPQAKNWIAFENGKPVPYGAADYQKVGRVTRYMADLSKPEWQDFTVARAMKAVDAGLDGLFFDNNQGDRDHIKELKARVLAEARKRNPQILVNSNYHAGMYLDARVENAITTEDGREPGIFPPAPKDNVSRSANSQEDSEQPENLGYRGGQNIWSTHNEAYAVDVKAGQWVMNVGLLRTLWAVSEGWRPVGMEDGARHTGSRFTNFYPPKHLKVALAEAHMFGASLETYQESKTLRDLYFSEKVAMEYWGALGLYNSFFESHSDLYVAPQSVSPVAVVVSPEDTDIQYLNGLAARNIIFDVVYQQDASARTLSKYPLVVAAPSVHQPEAGWKRIDAVSADQLATITPVRVDAPAGVLTNIYQQKENKRTVVHLLNYSDTAVKEVKLELKGQFPRVELFSPDRNSSTKSFQVRSEQGSTKITVSNLLTYDVLVLQ